MDWTNSLTSCHSYSFVCGHVGKQDSVQAGRHRSWQTSRNWHVRPRQAFSAVHSHGMLHRPITRHPKPKTANHDVEIISRPPNPRGKKDNGECLLGQWRSSCRTARPCTLVRSRQRACVAAPMHHRALYSQQHRLRCSRWQVAGVPFCSPDLPRNIVNLFGLLQQYLAGKQSGTNADRKQAFLSLSLDTGLFYVPFGQMLKCQRWVRRGLTCTAWHPRAMRTWEWE